MNPENYKIGAGSLTLDGVSLGGTTPAGAIVTYEPDIHFHKSGKYGTTPIKASLIGMKLTMKVVLGETTLTNMQKVMAGAGGTTTNVKFGGIAGVEIEGHLLVLTPFDGTPGWRVKNAVPSSPIEMAYQVENERVYEVTFTGMIDVTANESENLAEVS